MGSKVCPLWGQTYITDYIGNVKYQLSPLSFYQCESGTDRGTLRNRTGIRRAYWKRDGLGCVLWYRNDFPFLAQKAQKVYGVEIVPQAIEDAKHNAEIKRLQTRSFL